jgi:hypothetical protein
MACAKLTPARAGAQTERRGCTAGADAHLAEIPRRFFVGNVAASGRSDLATNTCQRFWSGSEGLILGRNALNSNGVIRVESGRTCNKIFTIILQACWRRTDRNEVEVRRETAEAQR